jgi:hypothetical protein
MKSFVLTLVFVLVVASVGAAQIGRVNPPSSVGLEDVTARFVTINLTAVQVHALLMHMGVSSDLTAEIQNQVNGWANRYVDEAQRIEQEEMKKALLSADTKVAAQVRTLLGVKAPKAVTDEERAVQLKDRADAKAAEAELIKAAERQRLLAVCQAENATLAAAKGTAIDCAKLIK